LTLRRSTSARKSASSDLGKLPSSYFYEEFRLPC